MTFHKEREHTMARQDDDHPHPQESRQEVHKETHNAFEPRKSSPDVLASYAQQAQDERISKELFRRATTSQYRMETERYAFSKIIGRGGMGVVLRGYDKLLSRDVAVKFLNTELNENEEARKIFLTEARLMAKLAHPNLVAVYDVGSIEDKVMMVVELIEGNDLYHMLKESPEGLDQKLMLKVGIQLTEVVHYLHEQGMVHRDLKPANVMLKPDETIKLIDFGLTRTMEVLAVRATSVRGTPAYMSPEQLAGDTITSATDIYQLGATFFELLSGKLPFEMASYSPELRREVPSLQDARPSLDPELCRLIGDCLAYDAAKRPQSAAEVSRRMQQILARLTHHNFEPPTIEFTRNEVGIDAHGNPLRSADDAATTGDAEKAKSRKLILIGAILLVAILGVGGLVLAMQGGQPGARANATGASPVARDVAAAATLTPPGVPTSQDSSEGGSTKNPDEAPPQVDDRAKEEAAPIAEVAPEPETAPASEEAAPTPPATQEERAPAPAKAAPPKTARKAAPRPKAVAKPRPAPVRSKPVAEREPVKAAREQADAAPAEEPKAEQKSDQPLLFDTKSSNKKSTTTLLPSSSGSSQDKPQLYQGK